MAAAAVVILIINLTRKTPKPMMTESCRLAFWLVVPGLFACLSGVALIFLPELDHENSGLALAGGGFLAMVGGTFLNAAAAKKNRKAWPVVPAHCTDHQLQKGRASTANGAVDCWYWQVVCEINYGGKHYVVTPMVHWSDLGQGDAPFTNEAKAQEFVAQKIMLNGECKLRVNPNNPLEAELI